MVYTGPISHLADVIWLPLKFIPNLVYLVSEFYLMFFLYYEKMISIRIIIHSYHYRSDPNI